ncbi:MAG TPA: lysylphosphatidylglycerol synthase domain-containing protein [Steroidobacteraceae bacterium]
MKLAWYIGGLLGLALLIILVVRADFGAMVQTLAVAGWAMLWLVPYRTLYFLLYAIGWLNLLRPYDSKRRAGLGYLLWVTSVREAIDRLLPVASVGGGVAGVRLLRWRGLAVAPVGASVIVEILVTLIVLYVFTAVGLLLLIDINATDHEVRRLLLAFLCSLPVPAALALLLRYGSIFARLQKLLRPLVGGSATSEGAAALDLEVRAILHRGWTLLGVGAMQLVAWMSGAFEVWFVLRLCGHPVGIGAALIMESMTQAMRHIAFVVPAGLGVQEAGLVLFGHLLGVSGELALAVSMAKRVREVLCGLPPLLSWQWFEGRRLLGATR